MKVYLLKDVENVGMQGEVINVSPGYGQNFLVPRKLGIEVNAANEAFYQGKKKIVEHRKEVISSKTSMLAEKIKGLTLTMKRKLHDDNKLYGSVTAAEIVDLLAKHSVSVAKSQVDFGKTIKSKGTYEVVIKLSTTLQPKFTLVVAAE